MSKALLISIVWFVSTIIVSGKNPYYSYDCNNIAGVEEYLIANNSELSIVEGIYSVKSIMNTNSPLVPKDNVRDFVLAILDRGDGTYELISFNTDFSKVCRYDTWNRTDVMFVSKSSNSRAYTFTYGNTSANFYPTSDKIKIRLNLSQYSARLITGNPNFSFDVRLTYELERIFPN